MGTLTRQAVLGQPLHVVQIQLATKRMSILVNISVIPGRPPAQPSSS